MVLELFSDVQYGDVYWAVAVLVLTLVTARIFYPVFKRFVHHLTRKTETTLDDEIVAALEQPFYFVILIAGSYFAATGINFLEPNYALIRQVFSILVILLSAFTAARLVGIVLHWYQVEIAHKTNTKIDDKLVPVLNKILRIVIYIVAGLFILHQFGVEIGPFLATLGIGGLAIALALQPTLSNFFAGTYVMSEGAIKAGDFIELEGGVSGFVHEIGSRSTIIRSPQNLFIIIPNSKLADSIIRNYHEPALDTVIPVTLGVGYASDLDDVEKITLEVAKQVQQEVSGANRDFEPVVRFKEFGDSNIIFTVALGAASYPDHHLLVHEFIKLLKKRYDEEGIEIAYPVRTVRFADEAGKEKAKEKAKDAKDKHEGNEHEKRK